MNETDKLHVDLGRYRALLRSTLNQKAGAALREIIAQIEERLRRIVEGPEPVC